jgi:hypothetical protein
MIRHFCRYEINLVVPRYRYERFSSFEPTCELIGRKKWAADGNKQQAVSLASAAVQINSFEEINQPATAVLSPGYRTVVGRTAIQLRTDEMTDVVAVCVLTFFEPLHGGCSGRMRSWGERGCMETGNYQKQP